MEEASNYPVRWSHASHLLIIFNHILHKSKKFMSYRFRVSVLIVENTIGVCYPHHLSNNHNCDEDTLPIRPYNYGKQSGLNLLCQLLLGRKHSCKLSRTQKYMTREGTPYNLARKTLCIEGEKLHCSNNLRNYYNMKKILFKD